MSAWLGAWAISALAGCSGMLRLQVAPPEAGAEARAELRVEVADDGEERALGLMYRDRLPEDQGMLFVYPELDERNFWMKNTRIPLSIAFLADDGTIVHIADMQPQSLALTPSTQPVRYALEVNQGWFAQHGVQVGDRVAPLPEPSKR